MSLFLQRYLDDPCGLASTILWFLEKEKEILQSADLAEQVEAAPQSSYWHILDKTHPVAHNDTSMQKHIQFVPTQVYLLAI